jgi:hypothetical protein
MLNIALAKLIHWMCHSGDSHQATSAVKVGALTLYRTEPLQRHADLIIGSRIQVDPFKYSR